MKGLDTNVILRLITRDDQEQFEQARAYIERHCTEQSPGYINSIVLAEVFWALKVGYKYTRDQIVIIVESLMETAVFKIEDPESVAAALHEYQKGADFADALIAVRNKAAGCNLTVSFDTKAIRDVPDFKSILT